MGTFDDWSVKAKQIGKDLNKTYRQMQYFHDTLEKGPKGSTGQFVRSVYGGSTKDLMEQMQGKTGDDDDTSATDTSDIAEADTRSTIARAGRKDKGNAAFNRRGVEETMVNPNKGKKHTLLLQKKGGR